MSGPPTLAELIARWEREQIALEEICRECPERLEELRRAIEERQAGHAGAAGTALSTDPAAKHRRDDVSPTRTHSGSESLDEAPSDSAPTDPREPSDDMVPPPAALGRYRLERCLGRGGFGEVWRAYDPVLDKAVAIKRLRSDREITERAVEQFLEEA